MFKKEIGSLSLELLVRLLLHNDDDITGLLTWVLVGFTVESVLTVVGGSLVNLSIDNFLLLSDLLALANCAFVGLINDFTFAIAIVTRSLRLRVHSRAELSHAGHDTATTASCALLDSAFFTAKTIAWSANSVSVDGNLGVLAIVNFLESALEWVHDGLALLRSGGAAATTTSSAHAEHS